MNCKYCRGRLFPQDRFCPSCTAPIRSEENNQARLDVIIGSPNEIRVANRYTMVGGGGGGIRWAEISRQDPKSPIELVWDSIKDILGNLFDR